MPQQADVAEQPQLTELGTGCKDTGVPSCPTPQSKSLGDHSPDNNEDALSHVTGSSARSRAMILAEREATPDSPALTVASGISDPAALTSKRRQSVSSGAPSPALKRRFSDSREPVSSSSSAPSKSLLASAVEMNAEGPMCTPASEFIPNAEPETTMRQPPGPSAVQSGAWYLGPSEAPLTPQSVASMHETITRLRSLQPQPHRRFTENSTFGPRPVATHTHAPAAPPFMTGDPMLSNGQTNPWFQSEQQRQVHYTMGTDTAHVRSVSYSSGMTVRQGAYMPPAATAVGSGQQMQPQYWNPGFHTVSPARQQFSCPDQYYNCVQCQREAPAASQDQQQSADFYYPTQAAPRMSTQSTSMPSYGLYSAMAASSQPQAGQRMDAAKTRFTTKFLLPEQVVSDAKQPFFTTCNIQNMDVSPPFVAQELSSDQLRLRSPVSLEAKQQHLDQWLTEQSRILSPRFEDKSWFRNTQPQQSRVPDQKPEFRTLVCPPFLKSEDVTMTLECPAGCTGFHLYCRKKEEEEERLLQAQLAQKTQVCPKVEWSGDAVPNGASTARSTPDQKVVVPMEAAPVQPPSAYCMANESSPAPRTTRPYIPVVPVEGMMSAARKNTDNHVYSRPRSFDMEMLEIGNFRIDNQYSDQKRFVTKVKIVPAKKRLIYEFPIPISPGSTTREQDDPLARQQVAYAVMVPFNIITGLNADKNTKNVFLTVSHAPLLFSSEGTNRHTVAFDKTSSADPSCGEMRHNRMHRIQLKGNQQVERFVSALIDFYPLLQEFLPQPFETEVSFHRTIEPLPEVDAA